MIQKKVFQGGMNSDTASELMPEGQDRYRLNVRVMSSENGGDGTIETMNGNTFISTPGFAGTNTVIGSKEDPIRRRIYYFLYNSLGNHSIIEYNAIDETTEFVLTADLLNFHTDNLITGIDIIELDDDNHLLYWTDNRNEPRKINIEKGIFHMQGDFVNGYASPFEARFITAIKQPPATPPTAAWSNDATQNINYLFKKNFTFKSLFIYDDKEESAYSPISKYVFPATTNDGITGEDILTQDNKLTVTVPTGSSIVKKIRIAAKETNGTDYMVIAELDKEYLEIADDSTYSFSFYNNGNYVPVEVNQSIKLFDFIPLKAQAQTLISGNRMVYANVTEGYDGVNVDARFPLSFAAYSAPTNSFFPNQSFLKSGGAYLHGFVYYDEYGNRSGVANVVNAKTTELVDPAVNVYGTRLFVPFLTETGYNVPRVAPNVGLDYIPVVGTEIYHTPPSWAKYYQVVRSKNETIQRYFQFSADNVVYVGSDKVTPYAPGSGAEYVRITISNVLGAYKTENPQSKLVYDFVAGDRIRFIANRYWLTIDVNPSPPNFIAPVGGNGYSYTNTSPNANTQNPMFAMDTPFAFNDHEIIDFDAGTQVVFIKYDATVPNNLEPGVQYEIYSPAENAIDNNQIMFEIGECRAITTDYLGHRVHAGTVDQAYEAFAVTSKVGSIISVTLSVGHTFTVGSKVKIITSGYSVFGEVTVSGASAIDVDITGYSVVGTYSAILSGTIYKAATFTITGGDCFRRYQDVPSYKEDVTRSYCWIESENCSNMFPSKAWNYGRPNRIDPEYRQINRPSTVIYTGAFIPETNINGLSSAFDISFQTYEDKYGGIYKLYNKNHQLTVYQELKVGSLPVGQVVFNGTDGGSVVGQSAEVLPEVMQYYAGEYGIGKNPESHAAYGNVEYFMDVLRGTPVRLSVDGMTPIGDTAFMHNFFTDQCEMVLTSENKVNIYGVYDTKFNEYVLAFKNFTSSWGDFPAKTLGFNEKRNEWSSFYSFAPEGMCMDGINFVSFKNGAIYTHNTNPTQANFYLTQYYPEIWTVMNAAPSNVKVLEAVSFEAADPWEAYKSSDATFGISGIRNGQLTTLLTADFTEIEGLQYAPVLRDINTPNITAPALPIFEGDVMRDTVFLCKFKYPATTYTRLFAINFKYIVSNLHNR